MRPRVVVVVPVVSVVVVLSLSITVTVVEFPFHLNICNEGRNTISNQGDDSVNLERVQIQETNALLSSQQETFQPFLIWLHSNYN